MPSCGCFAVATASSAATVATPCRISSARSRSRRSNAGAYSASGIARLCAGDRIRRTTRLRAGAPARSVAAERSGSIWPASGIEQGGRRCGCCLSVSRCWVRWRARRRRPRPRLAITSRRCGISVSARPRCARSAGRKLRSEFKGAVKLEPSLEMAHYGLGQVYMATKRYPAAVAAYLACRDAWAANISARASNDLSAQRQIDDQIQALEDERTLLASGRVTAMLSGWPCRPRSPYRGSAGAALSRRPGRAPDADLDLGGARQRLLQNGRRWPTPSANIAWRLKVDPRLGEAHNNLAVICMMTGRYAEAQLEVAAAEKSGVRVNPQFKEDLKRSQTAR